MASESHTKLNSNQHLEHSIAKSLFLGSILEESLFPFPGIPEAEAETVNIIVDSIEKFMSQQFESFRKWDREGEFPKEYLQSLKEMGLFGLIIPEEFGGIGLSSRAYARVLQQTSRYDASTSVTIGAHSSIGMKGLLLFGSTEQKNRYLPRLASGEIVAAFCLTEPGSGSDAASISTNASKNETGDWVLNGEKIWISNGAFADFFTVFARTNSEKGKISAFLVERSFPGVSTGAKEDKLGLRASATTMVNFDNVVVPAENLLGEEGMGFKIAVSILNNGRTGLGGGCIGGMKACMTLAASQAKNRKQFGKAICEFGLVQEKLGQMAVDCFAAESIVALLGRLIDDGARDYSVEAAIAKIYCSESLWTTVNEALQIAGGNGYMKDFPYERILRDSRINLIYEGTNEILRLYVALSGMKEAGQSLRELGKSLGNIFNEPIKGFGVLSNYATKRFTHLTSFGRDRLEDIPMSLRHISRIYEDATLELSRATDVLLRRHGKQIVDKQFAMKRVANIVIDLLVGLSVLSRVKLAIDKNGVDACSREIAIANIFSRQAEIRFKTNFKQIERNQDKELKLLAKDLIESEGYSWDLW